MFCISDNAIDIDFSAVSFVNSEIVLDASLSIALSELFEMVCFAFSVSSQAFCSNDFRVFSAVCFIVCASCGTLAYSLFASSRLLRASFLVSIELLIVESKPEQRIVRSVLVNYDSPFGWNRRYLCERQK